MNRLHLVLLLLLSVFMTAVQAQQRVSDNQMKANMGNNTIRLTIKDGKTFTATLADNSSADALIELLSKGDVTVKMEDYGNMEKVGPLGTSLPRNDRQTSTGPGDIILYQGKYLVIYYSCESGVKRSYVSQELSLRSGVKGQ